jgi:hypothetical protein
MTETLFTWEEIIVSLLASGILFGIWRRGNPREQKSQDGEGETSQNKENRRDRGHFWLFIACALWSCTGGLQLFVTSKVWVDNARYFRTFFSLLNDACFVLAAAHIDEIKNGILPGMSYEWTRKFRSVMSDRLKAILTPVRENERWVFAVIIIIGIIAGVLEYAHPAMLYRWIDFFISIATILLIASGFVIAFFERNFSVLGWISMLVFSISILAEFAELWEVGYLNSWVAHLPLPLDSIIAFLRTANAESLSLVFVALAFTWMASHVEHDVKEIVPLKVTQRRMGV